MAIVKKKLYPPILEGNLPAFYKNYDIIEGYESNEYILQDSTILKIPFGLSKAVSAADIDIIYLRMRTVSTNQLVFNDISTVNFDKDVTGEAIFTLTKEEASKLNEGQYYKVQLAFGSLESDSGETKTYKVGYFSTAGYIKCIMKPTVRFGHEFNINETNLFTTDFVGVYEQNTDKGDSTEKAYSYQFILTDKEGKILADSGVLLHDTTNDTSSYTSEDYYTVYSGLDEGEIGYIQYIVTTLNGLVLSTSKYQVMKEISIDTDNMIDLICLNNFENGYIDIKLRGQTIDNNEKIISGLFIITRSDNLSNFLEWNEITRFVIESNYPSEYSFHDYTVQQGVYYRYAIQQENINKIKSKKIYSYDCPEYLDWLNEKNYRNEPTYSDFEDMFLFDGDKQLKIRFDPKVTSFKNTIPEQKIETIGSKYPFIFRNGHVCYKEFPVGGLLAFQNDDNLLFLNTEEEVRQSDVLINDTRRVSSKPYPKAMAQVFEKKDSVNNSEFIYDSLNVGYVQITDENSYNPVNRYLLKVLEADNKYHYRVYKYTSRLDWETAVKAKKIYLYDENYYLTDKEYVEVQAGTNFYEDYKELAPGELYHPYYAYYYKVNLDNQTYKLEPYIYTNKRSWEDALSLGVIYKRRDAKASKHVRIGYDLTSDNIYSERYYKLKVLDWLTDGNVKLFRSPTEGNYLVRLLNVSMTPQEPLGRMIHNFTSTAYEIADLTYDNLVYYKIIRPETPSLTNVLWASIDINSILRNKNKMVKSLATSQLYTLFELHKAEIALLTGNNLQDYLSRNLNLDVSNIDFTNVYINSWEDLIKLIDDPNTGFYTIVDITDEIWEQIVCEGFCPGDIVRVFTDDGSPYDIVIGVTGAFDFGDESRKITKIMVKPNPELRIDEFMRIINYCSRGLSRSYFDTVAEIQSHTQIAEQFVGPKDNLMEPFNLLPLLAEEIAANSQSIEALRNVMQPRVKKSIIEKNNIPYAFIDEDKNYNRPKIQVINIERLKVRKRIVIPIFAADNLLLGDNSEIGIKDPIKDDNGKITEVGTLFSVTPFGKGYINNRIIYKYVESPISNIVSLNPDVMPSILKEETIPLASQKLLVINKEVTHLEKELKENYFNSNNPNSNPVGTKYYKTDNINALDKFILDPVELINEDLVYLPEFKNDGYCILQVFIPKIRKTVKNSTVEVEVIGWEPSNISGRKYFDTFTMQWWEDETEYDPTFSINDKDTIRYFTVENNGQEEQIYGDNIIHLDDIDEMNFSNMGVLKKLTLGNGVMAEVTAQLQYIDYDIEKIANKKFLTVDQRNNYLTLKKEFNQAIETYTTNAQRIFKNAAEYKRLDILLNGDPKDESIKGLLAQKAEYESQKDTTRALAESYFTSLSSILDDVWDKQQEEMIKHTPSGLKKIRENKIVNISNSDNIKNFIAMYNSFNNNITYNSSSEKVNAAYYLLSLFRENNNYNANEIWLKAQSQTLKISNKNFTLQDGLGVWVQLYNIIATNASILNLDISFNNTYSNLSQESKINALKQAAKEATISFCDFYTLLLAEIDDLTLCPNQYIEHFNPAYKKYFKDILINNLSSTITSSFESLFYHQGNTAWNEEVYFKDNDNNYQLRQIYDENKLIALKNEWLNNNTPSTHKDGEYEIEKLIKADPQYSNRQKYIHNLLTAIDVQKNITINNLNQYPNNIKTYLDYRNYLSETILGLIQRAYNILRRWDCLATDITDLNYAENNSSIVNKLQKILLLTNSTITSETKVADIPEYASLIFDDKCWDSEDTFGCNIDYLTAKCGFLEITSSTKIFSNNYVFSNLNSVYDETNNKITVDCIILERKTENPQSYSIQIVFYLNNNHTIKQSNGTTFTDEIVNQIWDNFINSDYFINIKNKYIWQNYNGFLLNQETLSQNNLTSKNTIYEYICAIKILEEKYTEAYNDLTNFTTEKQEVLTNITKWQQYINNYTAENQSWQDQLDACNTVLNDYENGIVDLTEEEKTSVENLKASLITKIDRNTARIETYTDYINDADKDYQIRLNLQTYTEAEQIAQNNYLTKKNELQTICNSFNTMLNTYFELIYKTSKTSIFSLIQEYQNTLTHADNENLDTYAANQYIEQFNLFEQIIINRLKLLEIDSNSYLDEKINEYKTNFTLWNKLKTYYDDYIQPSLNDLQNQITAISKQMASLEGDYRRSLESFDQDEYITGILEALSMYFATLGAEFKVEIKERYDI